MGRDESSWMEGSYRPAQTFAGTSKWTILHSG